MAIGWGIMGCGQLADAQIAPAIRQTPNAKLVAVLSRDEEKGRQFAAKHSASRSYHRLDDFLADPDIQAVYVVTPPVLHCSQVLASVKAGKHVLVDKPMAMNVAEAAHMVDAARRAGVKLMVGFMMRYNPYNRKARDMIRQGAIGKVVHISVHACYQRGPTPFNWRLDPAISGGGSLMDMGSHGIDLLRFFGGEIAEITAFVGNRVYDYPVEDSAVGLMKFADGGTGFLDASFSERQTPRRIEVLGSEGSLYIHDTIGRRPDGRIDAFLNGTMQAVTTDAANIYVGQINELTLAIIENRDPDGGGDQGLRNMQIIHAMYESARCGKYMKV